MSQLVTELSPAMRAFFEAFFQGNQETPSLEALREQVGAELEITVGRHRPYSGPSSVVGGHPFLPGYAVHVERELVYFSGSGRALIFFQESDALSRAPTETPPPGGTPPPPGPQARTLPPYQYSLLRVDERIDTVSDERDTIARLLATLGITTGADGTVTRDDAIAGTWADAIVRRRAEEPTIMETALEALQAVPGGMPTTDLAAYKQIMYRYATYLDDGRGTYYAKRNQGVVGAGGQPVEFPEGTTLEYRRFNVRELVLDPGSTYCLVNLPDGWGTGIDRQTGHFREIVFKLVPVAEGGFEIVPISWATRLVQWGAAPARDFFDFCFFRTEAQAAERTELMPDEFVDEPEPPPP